MTTVLLLAVLFGSVVAIILMVYLIDRVNRLELLSIQASGNISDEAPAQNALVLDLIQNCSLIK